MPVFDWLLFRPALLESFPAEGGQSLFSLGNDDPQSSGEDTNEDTPDPTQSKTEDPDKVADEDTADNPQQGDEDTNAPTQDEYLWIPRAAYEGLLAQLEKKDDQIGRKDTQLEELIERTRETNVLLQGYQKQSGLLPGPAAPGEQPSEETEEN